MLIDRKKLDEVFQYYDKDIILDIIGIFEKELPDRLERISRSITENNLHEVAFQAHSLKSVSGTFMAEKPAQLARKLEELARNQSAHELPATFEELKTAHHHLLTELMEIRKELLDT
jgi:HPt (histidine-containing phosphotransfer) domain-containing protein